MKIVLKPYFKFRKRICFYKSILFEVLETLVTICFYLESISRSNKFSGHSRYTDHFRSHATVLKEYSEQLRLEITSELSSFKF